MRDIIFVLGSQGWEKTIEENLSMDSVDRIVKKFSIPLRNASVDTDLIVSEFSSLMQYAVHFISLIYPGLQSCMVADFSCT